MSLNHVDPVLNSAQQLPQSYFRYSDQMTPGDGHPEIQQPFNHNHGIINQVHGEQ
jgi:hypothetical protein